MNKIALYISLLASYFFVNKIVAPENVGIKAIKTTKDLKDVIKSSPASAILIKTMVKGYLIKTYYQKYRVVYGFYEPEDIIVKTKKFLAEESKKYIGMSLFRIQGEEISTLPLPPGSLFINNSQFGRWQFQDKIFYWKFYANYSSFPSILGWGNFVPTKEFSEKVNLHITQNKPFTGENKEFGEKGFITEKFIPVIYRQRSPVFYKLKYLFNDYRKTNYQY